MATNKNTKTTRMAVAVAVAVGHINIQHLRAFGFLLRAQTLLHTRGSLSLSLSLS